MSIVEQLRAAIRASGKSYYEISRGSGVADPVISRFMSSEPATRRDIRLATAGKLAKYLGLELTPGLAVDAMQAPTKKKRVAKKNQRR